MTLAFGWCLSPLPTTTVLIGWNIFPPMHSIRFFTLEKSFTVCSYSVGNQNFRIKNTNGDTYFFVGYGRASRWRYSAVRIERLANQLLSPIRYTYRMLTDLLALWLCLFRSFQRPAMFDVLIYVFDLLNGRFMCRKVHDSKWFRWEY